MEAERFSSEQLKSKMEAETLGSNHAPGFLSRALPAVVPVLLISIGYVDPGKWVASIEGGSRFGFDLVAFTLIFNFAAIFCQYLSARVAVITGRDLAQICSDEYDTWTRLLLGIHILLFVLLDIENGILIKLSGESAFMLMSLLGATLVHHKKCSRVQPHVILDGQSSFIW